jgi:hypothetical protein
MSEWRRLGICSALRELASGLPEQQELLEVAADALEKLSIYHQDNVPRQLVKQLKALVAECRLRGISWSAHALAHDIQVPDDFIVCWGAHGPSGVFPEGRGESTTNKILDVLLEEHGA